MATDDQNDNRESKLESHTEESLSVSDGFCFFGSIDLSTLPLDQRKKPSKDVKFFNCSFRKYPIVRKQYSFF